MNPASQSRQPRKIVVLGGGPAGLYCALLLKKANPALDVTVLERNPADMTYGWGVVFSDRTLASFERADYKTYKQITDRFVIWDSIDVRFKGETVCCGGHVIASISRKLLLNVLQARCAELGVALNYGVEVRDMAELPEADLLIAADGVHSLVRTTYESELKPSVEWGSARYIWLGADRVLDAFTFIFHENEDGFFTTHAYPFGGTSSTFIVECSEATWQRAGLDSAGEAQSLAYCRRLLTPDLKGSPLLSNNSKWINFPTLKTKRWHLSNDEAQASVSSSTGETSQSKPGRSTSGIKHVVLLGDAVHTAHFSIGSGTKLAMEDAISLATALEEHADIGAALNAYELERKPVVETFQRAATESQIYFETISRYRNLEPVQFAFQLLTRSGRISYSDLHLRDPRFGDMVDRWYADNAECRVGDAEMPGEEHAPEAEATGSAPLQPHTRRLFAPPPIFAPLRLRDVTFPNRAMRVLHPTSAEDGLPVFPSAEEGDTRDRAGQLSVIVPMCAVSADGRVTPETPGLYSDEQADAWARTVERLHGAGNLVGISIGHAGRRGSTMPRSSGLDRPLREGAWPLISASSVPYTGRSQVPKAMDADDMARVRDAFVSAATLANAAGFDFLQMHCAQGYLLASFLSPLTNLREDEYGGNLEARMRYPLEVFDAVRACWPEHKPLCVSLSASDLARDGSGVEDAILVATALKERGCDLIEVLAGQTVPHSEPAYGRGFLTHYSDRIRNEAGIPTLVGGYITTSNEANTILAAGKADLCIIADSAS